MTFLPIVARELRVAARRRATYWSRSVMALCGIVIGIIIFLQFSEQPPHELSKILFVMVTVIAYLYALLAGVRSTSDCISEEKREGTLGLLFLTDLKGYDVVSGKLVATSLNAFYGLMAIVPLLAIPLLMGGITKGEFWRVALVLVNTFFFSLALGMFMSSISKFPRKAAAATFVAILFFSVGLPLMRLWIPWINQNPQVNFTFKLLEPTSSAWLVNEADYTASGHDFWWFAGAINVASWILLALASLIVPRSWQDNPAGEGSRRWRQRWNDWAFGDAEERPQFRRRLLDINAFFWLAARVRLKPAYVWFALMVAAGFWTWGAVANGRSWVFEVGIYFITALVLNTMLKLWVASEAGRKFAEDRHSGALELLLSTPMSVADIVGGQLLALRRQFLGPLIFVIAVECVFLAAGLRKGALDHEDSSVFLCCWVAGMTMLVADLMALGVVGMWVGLTAKNPNRATGITVVRVLIFPVLLGFIILTLAALVAYNLSANFDPGWKFVLFLWFGLGVIADAFFGITAWRKLRSEFRDVAVQRFSAMPSFWRRLFTNRPRPN